MSQSKRSTTFICAAVLGAAAFASSPALAVGPKEEVETPTVVVEAPVTIVTEQRPDTDLFDKKLGPKVRVLIRSRNNTAPTGLVSSDEICLGSKLDLCGE